MNRQQVYSLTNFILKQHKQVGKDVFSIFNDWIAEEGVHITNIEEALWVTNYITSLQYTDIESIKEALKIDKEKLEKEIVYGKKKFL